MPLSAPIELSFSCSHFKKWYKCLKMKKFGKFYTMDWQVLEQLGLDEVARGFLSTGR